MSHAKPTPTFARTATGIVREMPTLGVFAYHTLTAFILAPFTYLTTVFAFPDGDLVWATLLATAFSFSICTTYALLSSSFPRSGAEYVLQSRITHSGPLAFTSVFNAWVVWQPVIANIVFAWLTIQVGVAPFLTVLGYLTGNASLTNAGVWALTPSAGMILVWIIVLFVYVVLIAGFKWYVRVQWVLWVAYIAGAITIAAIFLSTPQSVFISSFNAFMGSLGMDIPVSFSGDYYRYVIDTAAQAINVHPSPTLLGTLGSSMVVAVFCQLWCTTAVNFLGEIKGASSVKRNLLAMPISMTFISLLMVVIVIGYISATGLEFITATSWTFYTYTLAFPVPPFFGLLASLCTTNPVLITLIMLGIFLATVQILFANVIVATRSCFAISLDRILPSFVCDVDKRTRTPVKIHLIFLIATMIYVPIYMFNPSIANFTLGVMVTAVLCNGITNICGAIFPFTAKGIYKASPIAQYKLGQIPIITITGTIGAAYNMAIIAVLMTKPELGVIAPYPVEAIGSIVGTALLLVALYYVAKWYRRTRDGIDISIAYREIPPE